MKKFIYLAVAGILAVSCAANKEVPAERQNYVQAAVGSREFKVDVIRVHPITGPSVQLTSSYSLQVKGDSLYSHLPYYGRAYSVPYGGGSGLNFDGKLTDYQISRGKRGLTVVSFVAVSPDDRLEYTLEIFPDGNTTVNVQPQNRQGIFFDGRMEMKE